MSKTSLCIELLKILYSRGRVVGIKELADILETNERNIPEYVRELREIGYDIRTVAGRYGGYVLERHGIFPTVRLNDEEIKSIMSGIEYLMSVNTFMEKEEYFKAMTKICSAVMNKELAYNKIAIVNQKPLQCSYQEISKKYKDIANSIAEKKQLCIECAKSGKTIFHPYKLYLDNDEWNVLGYVKVSNDIQSFRLYDINTIEVTEKTFRVLHSYSERDYLDQYGYKIGKPWQDIRLKITGESRHRANECVYGKDQKAEEHEDFTILSLQMREREKMLELVLSFGGECEVLEPQWLKEKISEMNS